MTDFKFSCLSCSNSIGDFELKCADDIQGFPQVGEDCYWFNYEPGTDEKLYVILGDGN